jgi:hypothetical protein
MSTDFEKDRIAKFTPVTFFKDHLPLSPIYHNIEPFLLRRTANDFTSFCGLFVIKKNNPEYKRITNFINYFCENENHALGSSYNLIDRVHSEMQNIDLKTKSYYIIDLRAEPDLSLNPIVFKNKEKVLPFVLNQICVNILNKVRGVIVFADSYQDIPVTLYSRSQFGLTEEKDVDLHNFVHTGSCKMYHSQPIKQDNKLYGYINCEMWPTLVYF